MVAAGLRELPGPGVNGHTCLRDSGLEGEPTGSVAWPRSSAGDKDDTVSWTHEQDLLSTHSEAPLCPPLTVSTTTAPEHFEGQFPALGTQIPEGQKRMDMSGKNGRSKLNLPSSQSKARNRDVGKIVLGLQPSHPFS